MQSKQKNILIFSVFCIVLAIIIVRMVADAPAVKEEASAEVAAKTEAVAETAAEIAVETAAEKVEKAETAESSEQDFDEDEMLETVVVGEQTWLKYDLNIVPNTGNSWCYNEDNANCAEYGRLYDFAAAKTICPRGFHLPTDVDWEKLVNYAGGTEVAGKKLKARDGWGAMLGGYRDSNGNFNNIGIYGRWWSAGESSYKANFYEMSDSSDYANIGSFNKDCGFLVRCVKKIKNK